MNAQGVTPILNVSDIGASFEWFAMLGFRKLWGWPEHSEEPTSFGAVMSNKVTIFICLNGQGGRGKGLNVRTSGDSGNDDTIDKGAWMSIWVEDVDAVHTECLKHGLDITHPPTNEPWGVREMHVRHPDGHVFRISRGIAQ